MILLLFPFCVSAVGWFCLFCTFFNEVVADAILNTHIISLGSAIACFDTLGHNLKLSKCTLYPTTIPLTFSDKLTLGGVGGGGGCATMCHLRYFSILLSSTVAVVGTVNFSGQS